MGKQGILHTVFEYPNLLEAILPAPEGPLPSRATGATPWVCVACEREFATQHALEKHVTRCSAARAEKPAHRTFVPTRDAIAGTWQCAHRMQQFRKVHNLAYHIVRGACQHFDCNRPEAILPPAFRDGLRAIWVKQGAEQLCADQSSCNELTCAQYVASMLNTPKG